MTWTFRKKKKKVTQCKIIIFLVTNDYITWPCHWFSKLSHVFFGCICKSQKKCYLALLILTFQTKCHMQSMVVIQRLHYAANKSSEYVPVFRCYLLFQMNNLNVFAWSFRNLYEDFQKFTIFKKYSEKLD